MLNSLYIPAPLRSLALAVLALPTGLWADAPGDAFAQLSPLDAVRDYVAIIEAGPNRFRASRRGDVEFSPNNGQTWEDRSPDLLLPLTDLAWTGSRLVAVGRGGHIIGSDDLGLSWQKQESGAIYDYLSVAWTGSHLLACGEVSLISHSDDLGESWDSGQWAVVEEGGELTGFGTLNVAAGIAGGWVVAGSSGDIFVSGDSGQSWYQTRDPEGDDRKTIRSITYTGEAFVAVGDGGSIIRSTSLSTESWVAVPSGTTATLYDVYWNGIRLIACGGKFFDNIIDNEIILTSDDGGQSWITRFSGVHNAARGISGGLTDLQCVGDDGLSLRSTDSGTTWQPASAALNFPSARLREIVDLDGTLVGAGDDGAINTSTDGGRSWVVQNSGTTDDFFGIARSGSRLLAFSRQGLVLVSDDAGATWTPSNPGTTGYIYGIADTSAGLFAVGADLSLSSGLAHRSLDGGDSWAPVNLPGVGPLLDLVDAGSQLVAVGAFGSAAVSTDGGSNWTPVPTGTTAHLYSVIAGPDYVVAGGGSVTVLRSTDSGDNWLPAATSGSVGSGTIEKMFAIGGDIYAHDDQGVLKSKDGGINWTPLHFYNSQASMVKQGTRIVVTGFSPDRSAYSDDGGESWIGLNSASLLYIRDIIKIGRRHIAVGGTDAGEVITSDNGGMNWRIRPNPSGPDSFLSAATVGANGKVVAIGGLSPSGSVAIISDDGESWQSLPHPGTAWLKDIVFAEGKLITVDRNGTAAASEDDGATWTEVATGATGELNSIAHGNGLFVTAGDDGAIFTSPDGNTWTPRASGFGRRLLHVAWTGQRFIACGGSFFAGAILSSSDGVSWTTRASDLQDPPQCLEVLGDRVVAMGFGGLSRSDDGGLNWTYTQIARLEPYGLHWDGKILLAGGSNRNLWYSEGDAAGLPPLGLTPEISVISPDDSPLTSGLSSFNLGGSPPGIPGEAQTFTVRNDGTSYLDDLFGDIVAANGGIFTLGSAELPTGLYPGELGTFTVTLSPDAASPASATLEIHSDDSDEGNFTVALTGAGISATEFFDAAASAAGLAGNAATAEATPFNDGLANLLKYASNLPLDAPATGSPLPLGGDTGLPSISLVEQGGQFFLRFVYLRRQGLDYTALVSASLGTDSFTPASGSPSVETIDANWERVTIDHPCNPLATPGCFGRVQVSLP